LDQEAPVETSRTVIRQRRPAPGSKITEASIVSPLCSAASHGTVPGAGLPAGTGPAAPATARHTSYQLRMGRQQAGGRFDEERWRAAASSVPVGDQVSLRGLPALLTAEILYGLQQRTRAGFTIRLHMLRALVEDLRRSGAVSILQATAADAGPVSREKRALLGSLSRYVRGGLGDTRAEMAKDVWDLAVFGVSRSGKLSFTGISQHWLRQAAKQWAADDLPRRRGACPQPGSSTSSMRWRACQRTDLGPGPVRLASSARSGNAGRGRPAGRCRG
jgi:hypothetical protein